MELSQAVEFARSHPRSVLVTLRGNGRPQLSNVLHWVDDGGLIRISTTADRAKYANLRRSQWAALHITSEDFWSYAVLEGPVEVTDPAAAVDDPVVEELVAYYRAANGEHDDWDDYRAAMVRDRRAIVRLRPDHAYDPRRPLARPVAEPHQTGSPLAVTAAAALFDMDGTIVDSTAVVEALWLRFCREHGVDAPALLAYSHGRRTPDIVHRFLPDASRTDLEAVTAELQRRELEAGDGIVEVPGAAALLDSLRLPWAVVTSAPRELAVHRITVAGLPVPEVLVPADEVAHGKPSPEGYLRAAQRLGVDPRDCVAFEDAEPGVRSALDAGARVVVVGHLDSATTDGLDRVADLTTVVLRGS